MKYKLKDTKEQIKADAKFLIDARIESTFEDLHIKYETIAGDIYPWQYAEMNNLIDQLVELITDQVYQNIDLRDKLHDYSAE